MTQGMAYPFPLRPGYLAQIVVPRDMSKAEADRLCAFVLSLATPQPETQPSASEERSGPKLGPNDPDPCTYCGGTGWLSSMTPCRCSAPPAPAWKRRNDELLDKLDATLDKVEAACGVGGNDAG